MSASADGYVFTSSHELRPSTGSAGSENAGRFKRTLDCSSGRDGSSFQRQQWTASASVKSTHSTGLPPFKQDKPTETLRAVRSGAVQSLSKAYLGWQQSFGG